MYLFNNNFSMYFKFLKILKSLKSNITWQLLLHIGLYSASRCKKYTIQDTKLVQNYVYELPQGVLVPFLKITVMEAWEHLPPSNCWSQFLELIWIWGIRIWEVDYTSCSIGTWFTLCCPIKVRPWFFFVFILHCYKSCREYIIFLLAVVDATKALGCT